MRLVVVLVLLTYLGKAQIDSAMTIPLLGVNIGGQLPSVDMAKRFGPNLKAGGAFMIKTKKNWLYGAEFGFGFGRNVKEDVLVQLRNSDGFIVDNAGYPADLRVTERVVAAHLFVGRVFKLASSNPNSGLMISIGAGYFQHKINLYDPQHKIAALVDNRKFGLDRLTNGFSTSQFIGYLFLSENRMLNFYAGIECYQGFTSSLRKMNYDTGLPDTQQRLDILTGLRFGWILPLYKKRPNDFYYN